jgi:hypothetical protein
MTELDTLFGALAFAMERQIKVDQPWAVLPARRFQRLYDETRKHPAIIAALEGDQIRTCGVVVHCRAEWSPAVLVLSDTGVVVPILEVGP